MLKNCGHTEQCGCSNHPKISNAPATNANMERFEENKEVLKIQIEDLKRKPMAHLHLHTFHSILDGAGSIDNYLKLAKEYSHPAMAITDHGTMSGTFEFWKKCKAAGVKPIIGMEAYINNDMGEFEEKKFEGDNSHQSIFVMNQKGFVNLNKLVYRSFDEGFYRRGRIKTDWLIENKEGLFITTSCCANIMAKYVFLEKFAEAENYLIKLIKEFGENIVAEIQLNEFEKQEDGLFKSQKKYNAWIIKMASKYNLMPIITNDVHYAFSDEAKLQDTLLAINQKKVLTDPKAFKLPTRNLYYASADDFHKFNKQFGYNYPEAFINKCLENTLKVAEKCNFDFDTKTEKFPKYEATPEVVDYFKTSSTKEIITKLAFGKLKQKIKEYKENSFVIMTPEKEKEYIDRLQYELNVIEEKGALDYFLVYWELIRDYKQKGYTVGPGRGSAAGCLLSWCLDITSIDPIRFDLYFERFMNPTRKSMPDIDVDFETGTDNITTDFLYQKYGKNRVLSVSTFSTFNEKGCLKDVVRAHLGEEHTGFDSDVHAVTKEMPNFDKVEKLTLKDWFINWPNDPACSEKVKNWLKNPAHKIILEETLKFQGQIRGVGQHAAGIVITPGPCWEYLPTNIIASNKSIVTAFQEADKSGKDLSDLQILKLDRLKIETLNVIKDTIKLIKEIKNVDVSEKVRNVDLNDANLYFELRLGLNHGIFQFESSGMNALIRGMNTENFEELVAANALYRPGPMSIGAHEEYISNKFHKENIKCVHEALVPILSKTNGVLIFQEQLMFIAHEIGGMSLGEGDMLRRYMDKASDAIKKKSRSEALTKKEEDNYKEFEKYWIKFIDGAVKKGYNANEVDVIKDWVIQYLGYSFNRSHALCYAYLAMQTLYLKHYYTTEFYTALLNHPKTSGDKEKQQSWLAAAIAAAMSKGIKILPPSVKSGWKWTMTGDKEISMGFSGINGLGDIAYAELKGFLAGKEKKLEKLSLVEFFELPFSKFNKTAFESCVKAGVFDSWSDSRAFLVSLKEKKRKKVNPKQQMLFDMAGPEFEFNLNSDNFAKTTPEEKRAGFIEVCNFDLEKIEAMNNIKTLVQAKTTRPIENIMNFEEEDWYYFILEEFQEAMAKNGKSYLVLKVGDGISSTKLRIFSPTAEKMKPELQPGGVYVARFEKNQGGFLNIKRNTKFKKMEL